MVIISNFTPGTKISGQLDHSKIHVQLTVNLAAFGKKSVVTYPTEFCKMIMTWHFSPSGVPKKKNHLVFRRNNNWMEKRVLELIRAEI